MKEKKNLPIGVIDSGVGGLTVLRRLREVMPQENFIYVGDTARAPYGVRDKQEIALFTGEIIDYLNNRGIKELVIACNTMTSLSEIFREISSVRGWNFPIVGMSRGVSQVLSLTKNKKIGVFATDFTISTGMHRKAIQVADPSVEVFGVPCTGFVPLIEGEAFGSEELEQVIKNYAEELKAHTVDTVILGCTHYPFLFNELGEAFGPRVTIVDPAEATAVEAKKILEKLHCNVEAETETENEDGKKSTEKLPCNVEGETETQIETENGKKKLVKSGTCEICFTSDVERGKRLAERVLKTDDCRFREISVV